ncbi:MAG: hypothetical protein LPK02_07270 [Rhodobacterales bacterium]|nr:hypothetical protein [Rhodobacterales bacterium]
MSDFPDFKEELERKASETLAEALQQLSEGETTPETAVAVLRALWGATAGLVSKELMELIAESIDAIEVDPKPRCRFFVKGSDLVTLQVPNAQVIETHLVQGARSKTMKITDDSMTLKEALHRHNKTVGMLIAKGYHE